MLHLVYRSYGGENWKNRPAYYSKRLALLSFLRAAEALTEAGVDHEILWVNDGPVADDLLALMRESGEVLYLPSVGMRESYAFALRLPAQRAWDAADFVYFSEDDYVYQRDAFVKLARAVAEIPQADYFAIYGLIREDAPPDAELPPIPHGWEEPPVVDLDGQQWGRLLSTTSSFGGRAGALREDWGIFRFCMIPHKKMLRDHDTCVILQGYEPHGYVDQLRNLVGLSEGPVKERVRNAYLAPFLLATNLRSHRKSERRRLFLAARPSLAAHMEEGKLPPQTDWQQVAAESRAWAEKRFGTAEPALGDRSGPAAPGKQGQAPDVESASKIRL